MSGLERTIDAARRLERRLRSVERELVLLVARASPEPEAPSPQQECVSEQRSASRTAISPAEQRVLSLLPSDLTRAQIAMELYITPHTVKSHVRRIYRALGVSTRADAVAAARARGYL